MAFEESVACAEGAAPQCGAFWEDLVATHGGHVRRCVAAAMRSFGWFPCREDVEDVVQNIWLHLLERRPETSSEWKTWDRPRLACYLGRVARNAVVDELRKRRAIKRGGGCAVEIPQEECGAGDLASRHAPDQDPEEQALAADQAARLRRTLIPLLGGYRSRRDAGILLLSVVEEWTPAEIAALLGGVLAESSVHTVVHRARAALARHGVHAVSGALGLGGALDEIA